MRYQNKVALITGGASGIGLEIVKRMAAEGAQIVFSDIDGSGGELAEANLRASGLDVRFRRSDATDEESVRGLVAFVTSTFGRLNVAVNNVGNLAPGEQLGMSLESLPLEIWNASLAQSLTSCFLGMKYQIPHLRPTGGVIVNTASMAGLRIPEATPSYVAAKAAVIHLTRYAAVVLAKDNVRVNAVAPGITATPSVVATFPDREARDGFATRYHPNGRMLETREVADAVLWLCSDGASGVTGHTLAVDGGWNAT